MSINERARFSKESLIDFLKHKYVPGAKFYRWHTMSNTRRLDDGTIERYYIAVGPKIAQCIIDGLHDEEISIDDYVFTYGQFWAECNVYRPAWFETILGKKERHIANCKLRENIRSKDKRRKNRKECKRKVNNFLNTKRTK